MGTASNPQSSGDSREGTFSVKAILAIWLAAAVPVFLAIRLLAPVLADWTGVSLTLVLLVVQGFCGLWMLFVAIVSLRREGITVDWPGIRDRLMLRGPVRFGRPVGRLRLAAWLIGFAIPAYLVLGLSTVLTVPTPLFPLFRYIYGTQPAGLHPLVGLTDPRFLHLYWFPLLAIATWVIWSLLGEEILFRGVLLPRLHARFRRAGWLINGFLYAVYYLFLPWLAPARLVFGCLAARLARRYSSTGVVLVWRSMEGLAVVGIAMFGILGSSLGDLTSVPARPYLVRCPPAASWAFRTNEKPWTSLPRYDFASTNPWQLDLRGRNLSAVDLSGRTSDLLMSTFDSRTKWPKTLPADFSPENVTALGRNPGLGVRELHRRGITGKGISIGIVDNVLLVDHAEYASQLKWYEEVGASPGEQTQMHASAVASIAVGRTVGVAPDAGLYFIGTGDNPRRILSGFSQTALGVRRLVEVSRLLPPEEKIRAISISQGWTPGIAGFEEVSAAVREAEAAGIFVLYCSMDRVRRDYRFSGLGRNALEDPDLPTSYTTGIWWRPLFEKRNGMTDSLLVPMDSRAVAAPNGRDEYVFYRSGGWSWVMPYLAGLYALTLQVDPSLRPDEFWSLAMKTGAIIELKQGGRTLPLGKIANPGALIDAVRTRAEEARE